MIKLLYKVHQLGYIHNDIEPENIFVHESLNVDDYDIKTFRPKIIESDIEEIMMPKNQTSRSLKTKKSSFTNLKAHLTHERRDSRRNFDVNLLLNS